jgi:YVTN family beta-propeller protein
MLLRRLFLVLLALWVGLSGCEATFSQLKPRLEEEGEVYLYLQPAPPEAERLTFAIDSISALRIDGTEVPLSVSLRELRGRDLKRQRLLAGEGGPSALLVPEAGTKVAFPFSAVRRKGYVIWFALKYAESVTAGFAFSPAFSAFFPDRPPLGLIGFVSKGQTNDVLAFNKKSLQVYDVFTTGRGPAGMAIDQPSRKAYVALSGGDGIDVIDVMAGNVSERIRILPGDEPREVGLTPDGRTLLTANTGSNTVSIIDTASRFEVTRIPVGNGPRSVVIEPTGRRAFVCNARSNTISVLDIPGRVLIATIAVDSGPVRGQFNRRGDRLYVIHELSSYVVVINPQLLTVVARFPVRTGMGSVKVDPNTDLIYLGRRHDFAVGLYEPIAFAPVGSVDTGASVAYMAVDGDGNTLFMVSPDRKSVLAANLTSRRIVGEIDVGEDPYWVSMMGER